MAEERADCMAVFELIWILLKRPFLSNKVKNVRGNQPPTVMDASASLSLVASIPSSNSVAAGPAPFGIVQNGGGEDCLAVIKLIWILLKRPFLSNKVKNVQGNQSTAVEWKYDVYLSFGGPDTHKGVIFEIYDQLKRSGIKTFMDEDRELEVGVPVPPNLMEAIKVSRFAIVVLSRDYACSTWCLEELRVIYECMEEDQNRILPVIYHLQLHNVRFRKISMDESYCENETRGGLEKMQRWSEVFKKVASFPRWNTEGFKTHKLLVADIVKFLGREVRPESYKEPIQTMDEKKKELTIESLYCGWKYDVFLSFRGPDARKGIASYLFHDLDDKGFRTFMDEKGLEGGEHNSAILTAIEESRSAIVILSPQYASSCWCLKELERIIHGRETRGTLVIPIFYNVEPYHVRHQVGSFEQLATGHDEQISTETVKLWKAALKDVANLTGFESDKYRCDKQLINDIVKDLCRQLRNLEKKCPGHYPKFRATGRALVKLAEAIKEDVITVAFLQEIGGTFTREKAVSLLGSAAALLAVYKTKVTPPFEPLKLKVRTCLV